MYEAIITFTRTSHHRVVIKGNSEEDLNEKAGKLIYREENPQPNPEIIHVEVNDVEVNIA